MIQDGIYFLQLGKRVVEFRLFDENDTFQHQLVDVDYL